MKIALAAVLIAATGFLPVATSSAQTCTTQSKMSSEDRTSLAGAAAALASDLQSGSIAAVGSASIPSIAGNSSSLSGLVNTTSPMLKGSNPAVTAVYLLDASTLKPGADGNAAETQFFCTLPPPSAEVDFLLPPLPPAKYGFAIVEMRGSAAPWRLSFLLQHQAGKWLMAGIYPKPMTAAGHDGLWYWTQARQMVSRNERWNAWLYLHEAEDLLLPASFIQSAHLEKLHTEQTSAAPPPLANGVTPDAPLVVKAKDGTQFRFTSIALDDSLATPTVDIALHLEADALSDQAADRRRNIAAMSALLAAYPELRKPFHGIWVFADAPGQNSYATEQAMADIH